MIQAIEEAIEQLRLGMEGGGNAALVRFIDLFQQDLARGSAPFDLGVVAPILQHILGAQQRGDNLFVADLLEYEILPRLRG